MADYLASQASGKMKQLLLGEILLLLLLVWLFYGIKSSIKTGDIYNYFHPVKRTISKKEDPEMFWFLFMIEILLGCLCLCGFVKISFELLRMLW